MKINKVLVANRGEIAIRVFRACAELNIRTVAIYSKEDIGSYHRHKADEAYLVGKGKGPIEAYLDIEGIIQLAKENDVDAIHPGYGFLAENSQFARRCQEEGIKFIGPDYKQLDMFGDKVKAKEQAKQAGVPVIPGSDGPIATFEELEAFVSSHGLPVMIKASSGGGGRGMRLVRELSELKEAHDRAKSEAKAAFGNDQIYVEKFVENPKHIEVQIIGDSHGNIVHLFERDCSIQRRHQKIVEIAPSVSLTPALRDRICQSAVQLMKSIEYVNAGTVEFLVSGDDFYFMEVNPRIQVEHTVTEIITDIDIVRTQILVAEGYPLSDKRIGIPSQSAIEMRGFAIQSRVTTEDPENNFMPDTGKVTAYRSSGGFGVRLDTGNSFTGAIITPYYDSLFVKVTTWAKTFQEAAQKMSRNLKEFTVRGVKTNIPFLLNVVNHEQFLDGDYDTSFLESYPELFVFDEVRDPGTKILTYIGNVTVNGFPGIASGEKPIHPDPRIPEIARGKAIPAGTKQILDELGPEAVAKWVGEQENVLLTDTTFRDAHQSLLATRIRTKDLATITEPTARLFPEMFSTEMWGGATFDVAYRFLQEDPWIRLTTLREKMPNVLFQMLLRGANAVGYKNYPDNVIQKFVEESAQAGIDVFRIFDSLNWIEGMKVAIDAVGNSGKIIQAAVCYTGDIFDAARPKYDLKYYQQMAKELETAGSHILAIKDMAGLLKPQAAYELISAVKDVVSIPVHLHTHDTSGNGIFTYAKAIEAGVDILDVAIGSLSGHTAQPSASSLYYAMEQTDRQPSVNIGSLEKLSRYWEDVRKYYACFESGMNAPHSEIYQHEMPGGQYSNLQQQAKGVGLGDRFDEVKVMYRTVNDMFGDIVKVTPSSKVVGDMALFMVQNDLTEKDIFERGDAIDFPDSVVEMFMGELGQPVGGWPEELQRIILKGKEPITTRPGELLEPVDFAALKEELKEKKFNRDMSEFDVTSYALYPKVFLDYLGKKKMFDNISVLDTVTFFHGMRLGETIEVELEQGKSMTVKLVSVGAPKEDGTRTVFFELNGTIREVEIKDESIKSAVVARQKADTINPNHIGATMPGTVMKVLVTRGEKVHKGDHLLVTEAMKMETTIQAPQDGVIKDLHVVSGDGIQTGDLLIEMS